METKYIIERDGVVPVHVISEITPRVAGYTAFRCKVGDTERVLSGQKLFGSEEGALAIAIRWAERSLADLAEEMTDLQNEQADEQERLAKLRAQKDAL
jgi:multidrug resistance efflux pump